MNDEEEDYEDMVQRLNKQNEKILADFTNFTVGEQKKGKIKINKAAELLSFFGNDYLTNYEGHDILEGLECFPSFIGDWFIRKCMWSDEKSLVENLDAFDLFLNYLKDTNLVPSSRLSNLKEHLAEDRERFLLRVRFYNDQNVELEDIRGEYGEWDDEAIMALATKTYHKPLEKKSNSALVCNLLLSSKAARFLDLKRDRIAKLQSWGDWNAPAHHWVSNWRCEDFNGIEGSEERLFIVSNERTRFSFLFRVSPGDVDGFFTNLCQRILAELSNHGVTAPPELQFNLTPLSGAAASLTSFQNYQRNCLHAILENHEFKHLGEVEERLNLMPTKTPGHPQEYAFPQDEFTLLSQKEPPFTSTPSQRETDLFLN